MTVVKNIPLEEVGTTFGVTLYKDAETNFIYCKIFKFGEEFTTCPDGRSAFTKIDIYENILVCHLPPKNPEDEEENKKIRIYLREGKTWLVNPETKRILDKLEVIPEDKEYYKILDFSEVLEVNREYLHISYMSTRDENRVYVFENKHWISVPDTDLGMEIPIINFKKVSKTFFQKRICLLLQTESGNNPLSIYFPTPTGPGEYFSIPNPPGFQEEYKTRFFRFIHLFERYVVVGMAKPPFSKPTSFYLWRIDKQEYIHTAEKGKTPTNEDFVFDHQFFNEDYILVKANARWIPQYSKGDWDHEKMYHILSTEKWENVEMDFTYVRKTDCVVKPVLKDGILTVKVTLPDTFEQRL